jgi:hypothetical protein
MSRFFKVISPKSDQSFHWEVRTDAGQVVARGVAESHTEAHRQAVHAKTEAAAGGESTATQMVECALGPR